MTNLSSACPLGKEVQGYLNNLKVSSECGEAAVLTNATILGVDKYCTRGLVLVENNQEGGMCCKSVCSGDISLF